MRNHLFMASMILLLPGLATADHHETSMENVDEYTCKEIIRLDGHDRGTAISFLHGYLLGKSNSAKFDPEKKSQQTDRFIDTCLDHPTANAIKVLKDSE